jgi:protein-disulfide isomerase
MQGSAQNTIDRSITGGMVIAALTLAIAYAYRAFNEPGEPRNSVVAGAQWTQAVAAGRVISGSDLSTYTMLVFTDLECPACRGFHATTVRNAIAKYGEALRIVYAHFPLSYHPHAVGAANATECVPAGHISTWLDLIYQKQDSLGEKSFGEFAHEAGIPDTASVSACGRVDKPAASVAAGLAMGAALGVSGTPTIFLERERLSWVPGLNQVDSILASRSRGRRP